MCVLANLNLFKYMNDLPFVHATVLKCGLLLEDPQCRIWVSSVVPFARAFVIEHYSWLRQKMDFDNIYQI